MRSFARLSADWRIACGGALDGVHLPGAVFRGTGAAVPFRWTGRVTELVGLLVESHGPKVAVGDFCELVTAGGRRIRTQVIGFRNGRVLSMPLEEIDGLQLGDPVVARQPEAPGSRRRRGCSGGS